MVYKGENLKKTVFVSLAMPVVTSPDSSKSESSNAVKLPVQRTDKGISVEKALLARRSKRSFKNEPLTLEEVSQLLWAAQGITDDKGHRTSPSAMASYPLEIYLLSGNVTGLPSGVYHYSPKENSLNVISLGNKIDELFGTSTSSKKDWRTAAPAMFIVTSVFDRIKRIPGQDMSRFAYIEAGAASENLLLEVISLGLGASFTAGFNENKTRECLGLAQNEVPIGVIPVGRLA